MTEHYGSYGTAKTRHAVIAAALEWDTADWGLDTDADAINDGSPSEALERWFLAIEELHDAVAAHREATATEHATRTPSDTPTRPAEPRNHPDRHPSTPETSERHTA
jgi:hypothetical protein